MLNEVLVYLLVSLLIGIKEVEDLSYLYRSLICLCCDGHSARVPKLAPVTSQMKRFVYRMFFYARKKSTILNIKENTSSIVLFTSHRPSTLTKSLKNSSSKTERVTSYVEVLDD